jgi:hypothetical protein
MARDNSTSRTRFAQSKFVTKTNKLSNSDPTGPVLEPNAKKFSGFNIEPPPELSFSIFINETLPATMETIRSHVNYLRSLPLPVAVKNRLLLKYWAMECRLEAVRLLLDEAEENGKVIEEGDIDPSCFDLKCFEILGSDLSEFYYADAESGEFK